MSIPIDTNISTRYYGYMRGHSKARSPTNYPHKIMEINYIIGCVGGTAKINQLPKVGDRIRSYSANLGCVQTGTVIYASTQANERGYNVKATQDSFQPAKLWQGSSSFEIL